MFKVGTRVTLRGGRPWDHKDVWEVLHVASLVEPIAYYIGWRHSVSKTIMETKLVRADEIEKVDDGALR